MDAVNKTESKNKVVPKNRIRSKHRRKIGFYIGVALMAAGAVFMLMPLYWMLISSFKGQGELRQMPPTLFPHEIVVSNFKRVLDSIPFIKYYINSLGTSILNTLIGIFTSCILGFVFAKYKFKFRDAIFLVILAFMMIPYDTLMTPLYKEMVTFKWTNSYIVLTVPYFINIFGIFLMRQFFMDFPDEYLEAAEMDGYGPFRSFLSIAMPMAKPAISALFIYLFMASYNSFLWPLISVSSRNLFTLPVGIAAFFSDRGTQTDLVMAASTMIIVPISIVFSLAQKHFVEGMTMGGLKG